MNHDEFVGQVQARARFGSSGDAERHCACRRNATSWRNTVSHRLTSTPSQGSTGT